MLAWEIEVLNEKKGVLVFSDKKCLEFVYGFAHFFEEGNYSNFPASLWAVIIGYCSMGFVI